MRPFLRLAALLVFAGQAAGTHFWLRAHGTVGNAVRHAWGAVASDGMALVFVADLSILALLVLAWLARDTRGLPAWKRAAWVAGALLLGSPIVLLYLSARRRPPARP